MRFVIKWNNGVWKIFDNHYYRDCETFNSYADAENALNA